MEDGAVVDAVFDKDSCLENGSFFLHWRDAWEAGDGHSRRRGWIHLVVDEWFLLIFPSSSSSVHISCWTCVDNGSEK